MVTPVQDCEHWRGLLAMEAVGQVNGPDGDELRAHVRGCEQCQADRSELSELVAVLALADDRAFDESDLLGPTPPRELRTASLDRAMLTKFSGPEAGSAPTHHTERHRQVWAAVAVAAVAIMVIGTLSILHHGTTGLRTVALRGPSGNYGTAILVPEAWGTSIELTVHGEQANQISTVSMSTEYHRTWLAGTYRSVATGEVRVTLACALPIQQIDTIMVTDPNGQEVLHS